MRHRIMAITSAFQADDAGSIPAPAPRCADIAQLVERTLGKGGSAVRICLSAPLLFSSLFFPLFIAFNKSGMLPG